MKKLTIKHKIKRAVNRKEQALIPKNSFGQFLHTFGLLLDKWLK